MGCADYCSSRSYGSVNHSLYDLIKFNFKDNYIIRFFPQLLL